MTTVAVREQERIRLCLARGWQENSFATLNRYFVMLALFQAESSSHPAAARVEQFILEAETIQHGDFIFCSHDRFMMTMDVDQSGAWQLFDGIIWSELIQEFTEEECLLSK